MPCMPYCTNKEGKGPAWSNSLFENNAEFSYGMCLAVTQQRENVKIDITALKEMKISAPLKKAIDKWFDTYDNLDDSAVASKELIAALKAEKATGAEKKLITTILKKKNHLSKKTMWMVGGDGWAYDIGYGGLDHV